MLLNLQFASCIYYVISRLDLLKLAIGSYLTDKEGIVATSALSEGSDNLGPQNRVSPLYRKNILCSQENRLNACANLRELVQKFQLLEEIINKYFGRQIVLTLLSGFICVTVQLHYTIRHIRYGFDEQGSEILVTISGILIGIHVLEYLVIFAAGDRAKSKWAQFIAELQRLRVRSSDEETRSQLFDIIHCMCYKRIEFHGCSLFTIDLSVVTGVSWI